nr:hypothetical protein [Tanacetum cinerariifolium]
YSKLQNPNELFQKLLEDLKELAEYEKSQSRDRPVFLNDDENHSDQNKECFENSSNEIDASSSNEEKEEPPQDSDIRKLIREECCIEVCEEQKQNIEDTMLELVKFCRQKEFLCIHDNVDDLIEIATILSTKEPEYSPSMWYENPNTTPEMESDEIIKSGVEELVPNLSENEVTSKDKREFYDDDFVDIEYVDASIPDPEIVSVEEENDANQEEEEVDLEDIFQIQDSNNSLLDNFLPEFETFYDHTKETRSGTTTHADNTLPEYDLFCFEIEPDQERLINLIKNNISDDSSNDPLLEEANLFLASDNSIPLGIENVADDSEGDIHFLEELLIDDSILSHESSDSNFEDNPSIPRLPPEQPDAETDVGEEISVLMNDKDKSDEDYHFFMFDKVFSFFSAESEDIVFDPGISV